MIDANIKRFVELVRENPDLRVIYMVDSDVVQDDFQGYWLSRPTSINVDSILNDDLHERILIRSIDDDYDIYESFLEMKIVQTNTSKKRLINFRGKR